MKPFLKRYLGLLVLVLGLSLLAMYVSWYALIAYGRHAALGAQP